MTISTKLYLAFGLLIIMSAAYGVFNNAGVSNTIKSYESFRKATNDSNIMHSLIRNVINAQLAAYQYRDNPKQAYIDEVNNNVSAIFESLEEADQALTDETIKTSLSEAQVEIITYAQEFISLTELYNQRDALLSQMNIIGPDIRKKLAALTESASRQDNTLIGYHVSRVQEKWMLVRLYAFKYLNSRDQAHIARAHAEFESAKQALLPLRQAIQNNRQGAMITAIEEGMTQYNMLLKDLKEVISQRDRIVDETLDEIGPRVATNIETILDNIENIQTNTGDAIATKMDSSRNATLIVTLAVIAANLIISTIFGQMLKRRLTRISTATQMLANGNLQTEVPESDKTDEIGSIARSLLVFKESLLENQQMEERQKKQEAQAQEERRNAMYQLANKFEAQVKSIVQTVASASTELAQTAEAMTGNVQQSTRMAQDANTAASETSHNVQTVASAVEEMSASAREISDQTHRSTNTVRESVELTQDGDRSAAALQEAVERVQNAVDIINTIAGQINLLALNATIESARAGEAGRGFAVVAGEVKHLAMQTASATQDIANVLAEMNQASGDIIHVLGNIKGSINTVSDVASSIASAIEEQSATTGEIASNMVTASQSTARISANLGNVTESTLVVQDSSEQVLLAAKELSRQAETLDSEINTFLVEVRS